jgi:hypothetical protein
MTAPMRRPEALPAPQTVRVYCRAASPDRARRHDSARACSQPLGDIPAGSVFVGTAQRMPDQPDGRVWMRCSRKECRTWNVFAAPEGSFDE